MSASFIGCKISLISKSEIRYEGILYTIDTKESTIALAKVRSFGTEDRVTDKPVAPRNEVYEYIIFRASDIKDLLVDDPPASSPGLTDPAIIQAQSGSGPAAAPPAPASFPSPSPSFPAPQPRAAPPAGPYPNQKTTLSNVMASVSVTQQQAQAPQQRRLQDASDRSPPGSNRPQARPQQQAGQGDDRTGPRGGGQMQQQRAQGQERRPVQQNQGMQQREPRDQREFRDNRAQQPPQQQQPYSQQNRDQRMNQQQQFQRRNEGQPQQQQQNRTYERRDQQPGGQQQQPQYQRRPQSDWPMPGQRRSDGLAQNRGPAQPRPRMLDVRKLEEYDFEKANAEFEELVKDVADMSINEAEKKEPAAADPTSAPEPETYNKSRSFFDSISCEAMERARGNSSRIDRRVERKQNQETFGVSSLYSNRWNQGYGRGGFRGGRGGGGYRSNNQNQNRGYYNRDNTGRRYNNNSNNTNNNHLNSGDRASQQQPAAAAAAVPTASA